MKISRRQFIKDISSASLLVCGGSVLNISNAAAEALSKRSTFRFIVASDGHYGQSETQFDAFQENLIKHTTDFHANSPLNFCVVNGDLIHDEKHLLAPAKKFLDKLPVKYFVTKGNHDRVSDQYWNETFGMPVNHDVVMNNHALLFATTSNEAGDYLSPDLTWMKSALERHSKSKNVFIFIHIPQAKWTKNAIDTPAFFELIKGHKNVRAVFHGHEHDQDNVKVVDNVPYMFDSHVGGSWGTSYRGFRVVEMLKDNSIVTYIMNPTEKLNQATF